MTESAGPFIHDDSRNELQKKRSSFVALRGKKFPFGLPLFGLKRASAYIPVRGRRVNMDYEDADDFRTTGDKRASSFYVGRGKKNYQPFLQLYPMLDVGKTTMDGQFEFEPSYPDRCVVLWSGKCS